MRLTTQAVLLLNSLVEHDHGGYSVFSSPDSQYLDQRVMSLELQHTGFLAVHLHKKDPILLKTADIAQATIGLDGGIMFIGDNTTILELMVCQSNIEFDSFLGTVLQQQRSFH